MSKFNQIVCGIILIPLFLLGTFQYSILTVNFKLNQDTIAEKYCVNKDKPNLHCNGKCHFLKEINKVKSAEKEQSGSDNSIHSDRTIVLYCNSPKDFHFYPKSRTLIWSIYIPAINKGYSEVLWAPPKS